MEKLSDAEMYTWEFLEENKSKVQLMSIGQPQPYPTWLPPAQSGSARHPYPGCGLPYDRDGTAQSR